MTINDLLHKRVLVAEKENSYRSEKTVREIKVLEISPSGNWVKIQNNNGNKFWKHYSDITPIEVLETLHKDKPKN